MKVIISRQYGKNETQGILLVIEGTTVIYRAKSLELANNGNQQFTSCIPEGIYEVVKIDSPKRGKCFHVTNVPGRDSILIHKGNFTEDTQGCILPGQYFTDINDDGNIDVAESSNTLNQLLELLPDNFKLYVL
jgi:hypothetical protein